LHENIFASAESLREVLQIQSPWSSLVEEEQTVGASDQKDLLDQLCDEGQVPSKERTTAIALIQEVSSRSMITSVERLVSFAFLSESPIPITGKEFEQFYGVAINKDGAAIKKWITEHSQARNLPYEVVFRESFDLLTKWRSRLLSRAANAYDESELKTLLNEATTCLQAIEKMALQLNGFSSPPPLLNENNFNLLFQMVTTWAHFKDPQYKSVRESEQRLLEEISKVMVCELGPIMKELCPWAGYRNLLHMDARPLYEMVDKILRPKLAENLLQQIAKPGGIRELWLKDAYIGDKFVLFESNGCLWTGANRTRILSLLQTAPTTPDVRLNALELVHIWHHSLEQGETESIRAGAKWLLMDTEAFKTVWNAAFCVSLNPRIWGTYDEIRKKVKSVHQIDLPIPKWATPDIQESAQTESTSAIRAAPKVS
jgi:hypothetical protein